MTNEGPTQMIIHWEKPDNYNDNNVYLEYKLQIKINESNTIETTTTTNETMYTMDLSGLGIKWNDKLTVWMYAKVPNNINNYSDTNDLPYIIQKAKPNECRVSNWTEWNSCNKSCGGGTQIKTRTIVVDGKENCNKSLRETRKCNTQACPPLVCDSPLIEEKTKTFYSNEISKEFPDDEYYWYGNRNRIFNKVDDHTCDISYKWRNNKNKISGYDRRRFYYAKTDDGTYKPIKMDGYDSGKTVIIIDTSKEYNLKYWNVEKQKYQWLVGWPNPNNVVMTTGYGDPISIENTINVEENMWIDDEDQASVKFIIDYSGKYRIVNKINQGRPWSIVTRENINQLETYVNVLSSSWEMTLCKNEKDDIGFELPWKIDTVRTRFFPNEYSTHLGIISGGTTDKMCIIPVPITK